MDRAIPHGWKRKASFLEPLRQKNHSASVPGHDFDPVHSFRPEDKKIATIRISRKSPGDQGDEAMNAAPEIDGLRRDHYLWIAVERDHGLPRKAAITTPTMSRPASDGIRTITPPISISITAAGLERSCASANAGPAIATGTKDG